LDSPPAVAELARLVEGHHVGVEEPHAKPAGGDQELGEAFASLDHCAHGERLQAIQVRHTICVGPVGPRLPGGMQRGAHGGVGTLRLRLDSGADSARDNRGDAVAHPRIVAGVVAGTTAHRASGGADLGVHPAD
jgi:hypothetical protein